MSDYDHALRERDAAVAALTELLDAVAVSHKTGFWGPVEDAHAASGRPCLKHRFDAAIEAAALRTALDEAADALFQVVVDEADPHPRGGNYEGLASNFKCSAEAAHAASKAARAVLATPGPSRALLEEAERPSREELEYTRAMAALGRIYTDPLGDDLSDHVTRLQAEVERLKATLELGYRLHGVWELRGKR